MCEFKSRRDHVSNQEKEIKAINEVYEILRRLQVLNWTLENMSEVELYRLREMKDPSRADNYPNFFATAIVIQGEKLLKQVERE